MVKTFRWDKLTNEIKDFQLFTEEKGFIDKPIAQAVCELLALKAQIQHDTADRFVTQLDKLFLETPINQELLQERVGKGIAYFAQVLHNELMQPLDGLIQELYGKKGIKAYLKNASSLSELLWNKLKQVQRIQYESLDFSSYLKDYQQEQAVAAVKTKAVKPQKGDSHKETLRLFNEGLNIESIAQQRNLSTGTVEGHLATFVEEGILDVYKVLTAEQVKSISLIASQLHTMRFAPIKEHLGNSYTFGQIKIALAHLNKKVEAE